MGPPARKPEPAPNIALDDRDLIAPYVDAIDRAFEGDCDFAQLVKAYAAVPGNDAAHRYSPGDVVGVEKKIVCGDPDEANISTSFVERFNLTTRMHSRRYTRLVSGFSRKLSRHTAAVSLHIAWYNLVRVHETLRVTPAMAVGVTDHVWTIGELVETALGMPEPPPLSRPPAEEPPGMSAGRAKEVIITGRGRSVSASSREAGHEWAVSASRRWSGSTITLVAQV